MPSEHIAQRAQFQNRGISMRKKINCNSLATISQWKSNRYVPRINTHRTHREWAIEKLGMKWRKTNKFRVERDG